jgi:ABC-type uncharacterized transport system substrate-binding protein
MLAETSPKSLSPHAGRARRLGLAGLLGGVAILAAGCIYVPPTAPVEAPPPPEPVVVEPEPAPPPPPVEAPVAPAPRPKPRTAILVSDDIPEYMRIAEDIRQRDTEHMTVYNLDGLPANAERTLAELGATADRVIAIGLLAATVGRRADKPMVFCQVYNYQDYDLLSPTSKGVQLLPPFGLQLEAWKSLAPQLRRIGIVTGPSQEALVAEIQHVVDRAGLTLTVANVQSDQEALLAFKGMTQAIDGFWLLPDNRILSPEVVREIMSYGAKHRKQVVVFANSLLGLGALMSVTSDEHDVADRVLARFANMSENGQLRGPDMQQLTKIHTDVNQDVANYLELDVPDQIIGAR